MLRRTVLYVFAVVGVLLGLGAGAILGMLFCDAPGATADDCVMNGQYVGVPLAIALAFFPVLMAYSLGRKEQVKQAVFYFSSAMMMLLGFPVGTIVGLIAIMQHRRRVGNPGHPSNPGSHA